MPDYEKLGVFYLGRQYDAERKKRLDELVLYDSKDLLTHAVCVGMTGSGKTGLCIALIEEAAIDGIPAIVVDLKGDLTNLALTFPNLAARDLRPFVNEEEARAKGLDADGFAAQQAELWKNGLAEWDEGPERIARLKDAAEVTIYTPASRTGVPVSILSSFAAPGAAVLDDREAMRQRVSGAAAGLLALAGIEAGGVESREQILLATILDRAWRDGRDLDLAGIVQQIQQPSVTRVGVVDLDCFFPPKDRFAFAMRINNLLASPGFEAWLEGDPLDVGAMLHTASGKPRIAIVSIAHLNDTERMFFLSLLLNQVVSWMRTQSGTTSLRALLYLDEIFGFFPPVANPPTKQPLLTLLKQARAFGLGVVLATQNPVDIDYKGLSNAGTWFVGRLQTERDKRRLLDGLEGAAGEAGSKFDRAAADRSISGLGKRIFLLHNVHADSPEIFETRWTLCYLRGPLNREQMRLLARPESPAAPPKTAVVASAAGENRAERPVLPPEIPQQFLPVRQARTGAAELVYKPMLYASAQVRFVNAKPAVDAGREVVYLVAVTDAAVAVDWTQGARLELVPGDLEQEPGEEARFGDLAPGVAKPKNYAAWGK
ncbi:MAG: ATP-binding protein, partial [Acidobacteria bacterium]|nr:ATP-binding protein [Acidobacteriota bacterium]